jgi:hypothetical protein
MEFFVTKKLKRHHDEGAHNPVQPFAIALKKKMAICEGIGSYKTNSITDISVLTRKRKKGMEDCRVGDIRDKAMV